MTLLRDIQRSDAFERVRNFDDCARFHVWHSRLGLAEEVDRKTQEALRAGRGFVVVGRPGSGKTSTLAAAIRSTDGFEQAHLPLRLSVSGAQAAERVHDPRFLAARVVRATAQLSEQAEKLIDEAASAGTVSGAVEAWRIQAGTRALSLAREVRQRTESFDFERTPEEVLDVASSAAALLAEGGLRPALLLEDADGLLRLPGKTDEQRHETANAFFVDGLDPLMRQLSIPTVIAVQPDYLELEGFARIRDQFDGVASVPSPSQLSPGAVELLLAETLRLSSAPHALRDVFSDEGLAVLLHNRFSLGTMRDLIGVCSGSVLKALDEGHDRVQGDDVGYAMSQR